MMDRKVNVSSQRTCRKEKPQESDPRSENLTMSSRTSQKMLSKAITNPAPFPYNFRVGVHSEQVPYGTLLCLVFGSYQD